MLYCHAYLNILVDLACSLEKGLLNILARLGTRLQVQQPVLIRKLLCFL